MLSDCDSTGSCHGLAGYLRLRVTDGVCLLRTRCVYLVVQLWIDITRQLLFECVREFALHGIETELEGTKQVAQCVLHRLVDCFIITTIMSERPQFTNESPVRREDECVDVGEVKPSTTEFCIVLRVRIGEIATANLETVAMSETAEVVRPLEESASLEGVLAAAADATVYTEELHKVISSKYFGSGQKTTTQVTKDEELVSAEDAMKEFFGTHTESRKPRSILEESNSGHIAFLTKLSKLEDPNEVCRLIDERRAREGRPELAYV